MRKSLISLVLALSLSSMPAFSANTPKAGSACNKKGVTKTYKGKEFKCLKKGGKLVWSKGKSGVGGTVPTEVSDPFLYPFPDSFNRSQLLNSLHSRFDELVKVPSNTANYKLVIDPSFNGDKNPIISLVKKTYSVLPFPQDYFKTITVITDDSQFAEDQIKEIGLDPSDARKSRDGNLRDAAGYGWAVASSNFSDTIPHEIFHVWQKSAYKRTNNNNPDSNNPINPPVWFDEGGAEFFGKIMMNKFNRTIQYPVYPMIAKANSWSPLVEYSDRTKEPPSAPYILGRLATEYIVASIGMSKYLQIYFDIGNGFTFPEAFQTSAGISIEDFYAKFDRNITTLFG